MASMGNETIEVSLLFSNGLETKAAVPAGISAGKYEVKKVPVKEAVQQVLSLRDEIAGKDWNQKDLDFFLESKKMGGNANLAVSAAFFKADNGQQVAVGEKKFPKLMMLCFEGGKHGSGQIQMQEFMLIEDHIEDAKRDYGKLKEYLISQREQTLVGAEGAFSPYGFNDSLALTALRKVFPQGKIAIDAAGCFQKEKSPDYDYFIKSFPVISIEDPFSDEDWAAWRGFYEKYGQQLMIVGDDLTVTNVDRIKQAIGEQVINAVVIKPDQIGTITQAMEAVQMCEKNNLKIVVSHRGEDTNDDWIADFAMVVGADFVKFGGLERGERVAKYNRLKELGMR